MAIIKNARTAAISAAAMAILAGTGIAHAQKVDTLKADSAHITALKSIQRVTSTTAADNHKVQVAVLDKSRSKTTATARDNDIKDILGDIVGIGSWIGLIAIVFSVANGILEKTP